MKDFVAVAGPMGVTHCLLFTQTDKAVNLRVGRLPRGPSVTFRVHAYSLANQVLAAQRRPAFVSEAFRFPPIVVLSGFAGATVAAAPELPGMTVEVPALAGRKGPEAVAAAAYHAAEKAAAAAAKAAAKDAALPEGAEPSKAGKRARAGAAAAQAEAQRSSTASWERALQLAATTLQHMFPPINVARVRLKECRRVVLFARDPSSGVVEMRHFVVRARPAGLSRSVKRVVRPRALPDLGGLDDVADWVEGDGGDGYATSDSEWEGGEGEVMLPQDVGGRGNRAAHQSVLKLSEDALRKMRTAQQEANVARKKAEAEAKRAAKAERRRELLAAAKEAGHDEDDRGYAGGDSDEGEDDEGESDDDEAGFDDDDDEAGAGDLGGELGDDDDSDEDPEGGGDPMPSDDEDMDSPGGAGDLGEDGEEDDEGLIDAFGPGDEVFEASDSEEGEEEEEEEASAGGKPARAASSRSSAAAAASSGPARNRKRPRPRSRDA
ncbi:ppan [Symbiodinium sp. KB8]|nr:ppan [Symbiodinium sp. KB8]